jgi:hypothetical protein
MHVIRSRFGLSQITDPEKVLGNTTPAKAVEALQFIWGKVDLQVGSMHPAGCRPEHVGPV